MLTILSDLHLTDGSTSTNVNGDAFHILGREIEVNAKENNAQEIHLLLLGDIFDVVRTDWWFDPAHVSKANRPWNGRIDRNTGMNSNLQDVEQQFNAVLDRILNTAGPKEFIKVINGLKDSCGQAPRITYVRGNHDRALNNFPSLQQKITGQFPGLSVTFADQLMDPAYGVMARHGHEWDDNCNARLLLQEVLQPDQKWKRLDPAINKFMAIGEVITAELMSGLVFRVREAGDAALADLVMRVDNLRPALSVFHWLEWETNTKDLSPAQKNILVKALIEAISGVIDSSLGKKWDDIQWDWIVSGDVTDRLAKARSFLKVSGYDGLRDCAELFAGCFGGDGDSGKERDDYYNGAKQEISEAPSGIQYIVYGHTHKARHDYFAGFRQDRVRMYVNTGTYLPLLERADDEWSFAQAHRMTMAFFYKDGEDDNQAGRGPSFDLWNGIKRKRYA